MKFQSFVKAFERKYSNKFYSCIKEEFYKNERVNLNQSGARETCFSYVAYETYVAL